MLAPKVSLRHLYKGGFIRKTNSLMYIIKMKYIIHITYSFELVKRVKCNTITKQDLVIFTIMFDSHRCHYNFCWWPSSLCNAWTCPGHFVGAQWHISDARGCMGDHCCCWHCDYTNCYYTKYHQHCRFHYLWKVDTAAAVNEVYSSYFLVTNYSYLMWFRPAALIHRDFHDIYKTGWTLNCLVYLAIAIT